MRYVITHEGTVVNLIEADAAFVDSYCAENGYSYEPCPAVQLPVAPTTEDRLAALEEAMLAMMGVTSDV